VNFEEFLKTVFFVHIHKLVLEQCFALCKKVFQISSYIFYSFSKVEIDNLEMDDIDEEEENDDDDEDDNVGGTVIDEEDEVSRQHMAHVSSIFLEASKAAGEFQTFLKIALKCHRSKLMKRDDHIRGA
jgi:hypothetical protein